MRGGNRQQPLGRKAESVETGPISRAAFGKRHVLGNPDDASLYLRRQRQREAGSRGQVGLGNRRDFMQRAAREAAAKGLIECRDSQRQRAGIAVDSGRPLHSPQFLA